MQRMHHLKVHKWLTLLLLLEFDLVESCYETLIFIFYFPFAFPESQETLVIEEIFGEPFGCS